MKDFIIAIISALVGGIFTLICALIADKRKEKREESTESRKIQREAFKTRPEMIIDEYKNYLSRERYGVKQECDLNIFVAEIDDISIEGDKKRKDVFAYFDEKKFNQNEWCCVIYSFKNVGETAISLFNVICTNPRFICLFSVSDVLKLASNKCLNYSCSSDKKMRQNEIITVKLCYHKDQIPYSKISAYISLGMIDENGRHWMQPLFAPWGKIYDSRAVSAKEYSEAIRTEIAAECFLNPDLW